LSLTYAPQIFEVPNEVAARNIILTPGFGHDTDHRWTTETPYFGAILAGELQPTEQSVVVDFGCGIGRLAKELIARTGCHVIGVDISYSMRILGMQYVESPHFTTVSPTAFSAMIDAGLRCDAVFSVWVLQHCLRPTEEIDLLHRCLKPDGKACVVNNLTRAIPTHESGWVNDGVDVLKLLTERFSVQTLAKLDPAILKQEAVDDSFLAILQK
jgi:SAM-dependent methyltransferase